MKVLPWRKHVTARSSRRYAEWKLQHGGSNYHLTVAFTGTSLDKQGRAVTLRKDGERVGDFARVKNEDAVFPLVNAFIQKTKPSDAPKPDQAPVECEWCLEKPVPYYLSTLVQDASDYSEKGYTVVLREPEQPHEITVLDLILHKWLDVPIKGQRPIFDQTTLDAIKRIKLFVDGNFTRAVQGYRNIDQFTRFPRRYLLTLEYISTTARSIIRHMERDFYTGKPDYTIGWW